MGGAEDSHEQEAADAPFWMPVGEISCKRRAVCNARRDSPSSRLQHSALAIGSNTAIFSVIDGVLLSGLPFPEHDRLVSIRASFTPDSELPRRFHVGSGDSSTVRGRAAE